MNLKEPVSGRQFAKMVGQTEGAVRKAVERKSIDKGKTPDGKFIPAIASEEWGKEILPEFLIETAVAPKKEKVVKSKSSRADRPDPTTADEYVKDMMREPVPKVSKEDMAAVEATPISDGMSKIEAERKIAVYKARMAEIAYQEKKGELLPRYKIDKVLFELARQIRKEFEELPAQTIDKIRACNERHEALRAYKDCIHSALNVLSNVDELEL